MHIRCMCYSSSLCFRACAHRFYWRRSIHPAYSPSNSFCWGWGGLAKRALPVLYKSVPSTFVDTEVDKI